MELSERWMCLHFLKRRYKWALRLDGFKASLLQSEDHPFDSDSAYKEDKMYSNLKDDISYYTHAAVAQRLERHIANVKVEISKFFCCSWPFQ